MQNSNQTPLNSNSKYNHFINQLKVLELYLKENIATRYMAAIETGIPIQNICRYVDMLRDENLIAVVKKDFCKISGFTAEYLTTNPELFPKDNQLKIWG
mgnify:CR=1 FL=1